MDWSNENFVRLYTRETDDELVLSWDARSVWRAMLMHFDRSGLIALKRGRRGLAALLRAPLELVEVAIPELLADGRIRELDAGYFAPNFMEAQEANKSDRQRQKESRERRRAKHAVTEPAADVTKRDADLEAVTFRDANVTPPREVVTLPIPSLPDPSLAARESSLPRAIPPTTKPATAPIPASSWQRQSAWWDAMRDAHTRLRTSGIKPGTPDFPANFMGYERELAACARFLREAGYDDAGVDDKMRHVVLVAEAEAAREGHLDWFKPKLIWDLDRFKRAVDTTLEEAKRGPQRSRAAAAPAGPREVRVKSDMNTEPAPHPAFRTRSS